MSALVPPPVRETAAARLVRRTVAALPDERVEDVLRRFRDERPDAVEIACAVDRAGRFLGAARVVDLLGAPPEAPLAEFVRPDAPHVALDDDQEHVASVAVHAGLDAVPVVDAEGRLAGVVPARELIAVLRREHVEDLHRLAGIRRERSHAPGAPRPRRRGALDRLPWLLVGLAGSALATAVVARFEADLERTVAVAFFVPAIVYLADAIGTQTEAITVRALSLARMDLRSEFVRELATGALIGGVLAAVAFPATWLAFGDPRLALAVAVSLLAAGTVATTIGLVLPWFLASRGRDPALGSGPLATIVQDVLSLVIYFAVVRALVV